MEYLAKQEAVKLALARVTSCPDLPGTEGVLRTRDFPFLNQNRLGQARTSWLSYESSKSRLYGYTAYVMRSSKIWVFEAQKSKIRLFFPPGFCSNNHIPRQ